MKPLIDAIHFGIYLQCLYTLSRFTQRAGWLAYAGSQANHAAFMTTWQIEYSL